MKTLLNVLLIAGLLGTASTAMAIDKVAGTTEWNGNTGQLKNMCKFTKNESGTMSYHEPTGVWTVTQAAKVTVKARGNKKITVTTNGKLYDGSSVVGETKVDYGNSFVNGVANASAKVRKDKIIVGMRKKQGYLDFYIKGTATMKDDTLMLKSNTDYDIKHTLTCIQ